jgi:hypothetical protein
MEYVIGFSFAFLVIFIVFKIQENTNILSVTKIKKIRYSQSHIHHLIGPLLPKNSHTRKKKNTQASLFESRNSIKVIIMDNSAYWIKDNIFYMADMSINGDVDKETTRRVDTMHMNKVQLDKMMFIIDKLREEEKNDSGSSGN